MSNEICGKLVVGDLIMWTHKYDASARKQKPLPETMKKNFYSYYTHHMAQISNSSILISFDKEKYTWLCNNKLYTSLWCLWIDDYFKTKL